MRNIRLIIGCAALLLAAALPCGAADAPKTQTLQVDKLELRAESGRTAAVAGWLVQAGRKSTFTAAAVSVKRLEGGALQVELIDAVLEEVKAVAVGPPVKVDGGWRFTLSAEAARTALGKDPASVTLAGDFNNWNSNDGAAACRLQDGVWTAVIALQPGKHTYKFVLDGGAKWKEDPSNPEKVDDGFGGSNSVVNVP